MFDDTIMMMIGLLLLQTTQPTRRCSCYRGLANPVPIVLTPAAPAMGALLPFWGQAGHADRWMADNAPHKTGRCRD